MAAAEAILFPSTSVYTDASLRVSQTAALALADAEQDVIAGKKRKNSPLLVSSVNAQPKAPADGSDYLDKLIAYMAAVLIVSTNMAQNQSQLSQTQVDLAQTYVALGKQEADDEASAIAAQQKAAAEAAHKSWLQRIISSVVSAVMMVVGVLTLDPALVVMGALMMPVDSNGDSAISLLNKQLSSNTTLKIFEEVGILVALSLFTGGLGAGVELLMEEGGEEAAVGASEAGVDAGADAGAAEAGDAAGEAEADAVENEEVFAEESSQGSTVLNKVKAALSKILSQMKQMLFVENPSVDIAKAAGASNATAQYIGMSIAFGANFASFAKDLVSGYKAAVDAGKITENTSWWNDLKMSFGASEPGSNLMARINSMGPKTYAFYTYAAKFLKVAILGLMIAEGVFGIQAGQQQYIQGQRTIDLAKVKADLSVNTTLTGMVNATTTLQQNSADAVNKAMSMINSRWDAYVAPYATAVEVMG